MLNKKAKIERTRKQVNSSLQKMSETSTATSMILSALGWEPGEASSSKREKVAVVTVDDTISSSLSYEIICSLRQIRQEKNVKYMVLRVDSPDGSVTSSEAILEEIKLFDKVMYFSKSVCLCGRYSAANLTLSHLISKCNIISSHFQQPVICSMSNAAASGGFYIAMNSEKIFALPTTLTGSIGVFGVKFDTSKWAKSYGIGADYYPRGSHAAAMHPLTPLTPGMKDNIARMVLDYYDYFKSIVATGRSLLVEEVEKVAQGRVWTGEQAKEVGLVDALGGLDRAIYYAKAAHTKTENVEIEHWPKSSFRREDLPELLAGQESSYLNIVQALLADTMGLADNAESGSVEQFVRQLKELKFSQKPHFLMTMDDKTAMDLIMRGE